MSHHSVSVTFQLSVMFCTQISVSPRCSGFEGNNNHNMCKKTRSRSQTHMWLLSVCVCVHARAATILVCQRGYQINTGGNCCHSNTIVQPSSLPSLPPLPLLSSPSPTTPPPPPPLRLARRSTQPESEDQRGERSARFVSLRRGKETRRVDREEENKKKRNKLE